MTGSEFIAAYASKGLAGWEAVALDLARQGQLVDHPFVDLVLEDELLGKATLKVRSDVLAVGTPEDSFRLPLTPLRAQDILNLTGELLPTPWLAFQIWRAASLRLEPTAMVPNQGASLVQYQAHSRAIDQQIANSAVPQVAGSFSVAGIKKHVVVSNAMKPGAVVIFGWYRPSPPAPDVFDDRTSMGNPKRQPIQPLSNVHGDFYVDYSHGIQGVHPQCVVNGQTMRTEDLYRHPTLSKFVSHEGPLRTSRYPSKVPVGGPQLPVSEAPTVHPSPLALSVDVVPTLPGVAEMGFRVLTRKG